MTDNVKDKKNSVISVLQGSPIFQFLSIISILIGIASSLNSLKISPLIYLLSIAVIIIAALHTCLVFYRRNSAQQLPSVSGEFTPFPKETSWEPWRRENVTNRLVDIVKENFNRHVLIISPSGTGKSIMLNRLVPSELSEYTPIFINDYENIIERVLSEIGYVSQNDEAKKGIGKLLTKMSVGDVKVENFEEEMVKYVNLALQDNKILFCFDQVERYFINSEQKSIKDYNEYADRRAMVKSLLKLFNSHETIRSVFAIRSEYVFGSLISLFDTKLNGTDLDDYVEFFFLWGVNSEDDEDEYFRIYKYFQDRFGGTTVAQKIFHISGLESSFHANTFLLNLSGYVFDALSERERYKDLLLSPTLTDEGLIDIYFDAAFEGYVAKAVDFERAQFDAILYSLASENKLSGKACNLERLAGISHYPTDAVSDTLSYLLDIGIVQSTKENNHDVYRITHDKISDRLLKSDKLDLRSRAIDGIRYLTENRVPTTNLTIPKPFPKALETSANEFFSLSYFIVVCFVAFGFLRLFAPDLVWGLLNPMYMFVESISNFRSPTYYKSALFYVPHFITHVAWVSYIDRMNRSYIQNVGNGGAKFFGGLLSTVGVVFGILVSFSPQLFAIPLVVVGIMYGLILYTISHQKSIGGEMKSITRNWGLRTVGNILIVFLFGMLSAPFFEENQNTGLVKLFGIEMNNTFYFIAVILTASLLLWFWHHISGDQNKKKIWSANLALYDKGRYSE